MKLEHTLSIIKPDAVSKNIIGSIIHRFETAKLKVVGIKMVLLNNSNAKLFYKIHEEKDFFEDLINFITSGPIIVKVLEGANAIKKNREIIGNTNPNLALAGTLRSDYSDNITRNIIHGSDSEISAKKEIDFFFKRNEIFSKF